MGSPAEAPPPHPPSVPRRRGGGVLPSLLLALTAAVPLLLSGGWATPAAAARPTILVPPASRMVLPAGAEGTLAVVAVNRAGGGGRGLSYQWQLRVGGRGGWVPLPGETRRTLTATMPCTSRDNPWYRVAVTPGGAAGGGGGGDADTAYSAPSRWQPQGIELPQLLQQPPPAVVLVDGQGGSAAWTVRHPAERVVLSTRVYFAAPRGGRTPLPPGMSVRRVAFPGAASVSQVVLSWTPAGVAAVRRRGLDGRSLRLRYEATCNGGGPDVGGPFLARDTVVLLAGGAAEAAAPTPLPTCGGPPGSTSTADLDGWLLNNGSAAIAKERDCGMCRAKCRATAGCNVWVWGRPGGGAGRDGECWHKRSRPLAGEPPVKHPAPGADTPAPGVWLSGTIDRAQESPTCPGRWGADVDGEVVRAGNTLLQSVCNSCSLACLVTKRCNVWVWNFKGFGGARHRECWLKRVPDVKALVYKPGSFGDDSQWVSGTLDR